MKYQSLSIFFFLLAAACCSGRLPAQERPNIIVIFTDDQGFSDLGVQGVVDDVRTPNLDRLAARGIRMTSGYITAPQCVPSRAGLLSGRYQQRFGMDDNGVIPMPLEQKLLPELMQEAGYVTGMTGKWHLEPLHVQPRWVRENIPEIAHKEKFVPADIPIHKKMPYFPSARGFDEYFYGPMNRFWANYDLAGNDLEPQWLKLEGYRLDLQTEAALTFIDRNHQQPFFFYLPYFAPHVPMEATQKYLDRFPGDMPERRRYCLAMLSAIDDGVGRLLDRLEEHGIADNTFIFFISDNGAPLKIDKKDIPISFPGGAWDGSLNDPWVGEKGMLSEGGIRVPFIISWPAGLPRGIVSDEPVIALDVAATSVALAGLQSDNELDGVNLIPFLSGKKSKLKRKALYWRFWDQSAIRMGKWKLLKAGRREYLFDLDSPAHERKNLIRQYPGKAKKLKKQLEKWGASLKTPGIPDGALKRELKWYDYYFAGMH